MTTRSSYAIAIASTLCLFSVPALAQGAGVCDRQASEIGDKVNSDAAQWIAAIEPSLPQDEKDAYTLLFSRNRDRALALVDSQKNACTAQYKPMQDMMDIIVIYYTGGISKILEPRMTHVDVSELLKGYPLGGPNALVPKFRESILNGDNGTIANILRDPIQCLTFARKC